MKFAAVPGMTPVFGSESADLTVLALAIPALLALFLGARSDTAVFGAFVVGAVVILLQ